MVPVVAATVVVVVGDAGAAPFLELVDEWAAVLGRVGSGAAWTVIGSAKNVVTRPSIPIATKPSGRPCCLEHLATPTSETRLSYGLTLNEATAVIPSSNHRNRSLLTATLASSTDRASGISVVVHAVIGFTNQSPRGRVPDPFGEGPSPILLDSGPTGRPEPSVIRSMSLRPRPRRSPPCYDARLPSSGETSPPRASCSLERASTYSARPPDMPRSGVICRSLFCCLTWTPPYGSQPPACRPGVL